MTKTHARKLARTRIDDKDLAPIAAVPDMIEALQDMLAAYDHEPNTYDTAATAAFERARNALQKAGVIE